MMDMLRELVTRRNLLFMMAWREIRAKYKQSIMGLMWAVLMPVLIVCAGFIVRMAIASASGKPVELADLMGVAVKAAPWAFFVTAIRFGTMSMIKDSHLVTKIYLPRLVFPLASVLSALVDFVVAATAIIVVLAIARIGVSVHLLWVPLLLAVFIVITASLAVALSALSVFLRDVKFLVEVFLTFAIFFTPVFYESSMFGKYATLLLLNPVSPLLEGLAAAVIHQASPSLPWLAYSCVMALVLMAAALTIFRVLEPRFAESI